MDEFLRIVNVIFINNVHFSDNLEHQLLEKFVSNLKHGTRIVTCRELPTVPNSNRSIFQKKEVYPFEFERGTIYYYNYTVDRFWTWKPFKNKLQ